MVTTTSPHQKQDMFFNALKKIVVVDQAAVASFIKAMLKVVIIRVSGCGTKYFLVKTLILTKMAFNTHSDVLVKRLITFILKQPMVF